MVMPVTLRRFTVDDLDRFPPDGNRYELLDGVLFVTPAPLPLHEEVVSRLIRLLGGHLDAWPEVRLAPQSEVVLRPDHKLEPDLLVYRAERIPRSWGEVEDRWLAVEVASPSTRVYDREYKLEGYLALGVREVWLVDPREGAILVGHPGGRISKADRELVWRPPAPVPPLRLDVQQVFAGLPLE
jgi:Uma2 family endonuclease